MATKNSLMLGMCMLIISIFIFFEQAAGQELVPHMIARREISAASDLANFGYKLYKYYDRNKKIIETVNWTLSQAESYVDQQCQNSQPEHYCCLNDDLLNCEQCCLGPRPESSSLIYSPTPSPLPSTSSKLLFSFSWQLLSLMFVVMYTFITLMGGCFCI